MVINTSSRASQAREHLIGYIRENGLQVGEKLPSEPELAAALGVSRNTIREAYIALESENIVERRHGIGTFISQAPKIKEQLLDELIGFPHDIESAGYEFDFELISKSHITPPEEIREALQAEPNQQVLQVKFLLFANHAPAVYIMDHFAPWIDERRFDWDGFDGDMFTFVSVSLGIPERRIHTCIRASLAEGELAERLALSEGTPIVNVLSTVSTMDGKPTTFSSVYLNPKNFEFELTRVYRYR